MLIMPPIVDAQAHVWLPESASRPWPAGGRAWRERGHRPERVDEAVLLREMRAAGVDRAVLVPPLFEGFRNDYAISVAEAHPETFRVMARLDLQAEEPALHEAVRGIRADPLVPGVRLVFLPPDAGPLAEHLESPLWPEAQEHDLPIAMYAPGQLAEVAALAKRFPALRLAVDHLGLSGNRTDRGIAHELDSLLQLARFPNVSVKLTALPCYSNEPYPHSALHRPARAVIDAFGAARVFWGSDLSRLPGRYEDAVALARDHICRSDEEASAVLGASLLRWLCWPE